MSPLHERDARAVLLEGCLDVLRCAARDSLAEHARGGVHHRFGLLDADVEDPVDRQRDAGLIRPYRVKADTTAWS